MTPDRAASGPRPPREPPRWLRVALDTWKSPASRDEQTREQDVAAGGRECRRVDLGGGRSATASISLRRFPDGRRVYAYLRYKTGVTSTATKYIGQAREATRAEALAAAWDAAREKGLLTPGGRSR